MNTMTSLMFWNRLVNLKILHPHCYTRDRNKLVAQAHKSITNNADALMPQEQYNKIFQK